MTAGHGLGPRRQVSAATYCAEMTYSTRVTGPVKNAVHFNCRPGQATALKGPGSRSPNSVSGVRRPEKVGRGGV